MIPLLLLALAADPAPGRPTEDALPAGAVARLGSTQFYTGTCRGPFAVSPDGRQFAALGSGIVFSTVTGREESRIEAHHGLCCTFSPDGRTIAVGGYQTIAPATASVTVIDAATGKVKAKLPGQSVEQVEFVAFAGNQTLVSGGKDGSFRVWDLNTETEVRQFPRTGHYYPKAEGVSPDGHFLATVDRGDSHDGPLHVYDVNSGRELFKAVIPGSAYSLLFAPDSRSLVCIGTTIRRFELPTGRPMDTWKSPEVHAVFACSNESLYYLRFQNNSLTVHDVTTRAPAKGPLRLPVCMENRAAPTDVYVVGGSTRLGAWDLATGKPRHPTGGSPGDAAVAVTADGRVIIASLESVQCWTADGRMEHAWPCRSNYRTYASALAPDGRTFVNGDAGGVVRLWDTATGKQTGTFKTEVNVSCSFAFSPDGRYLAYPSWHNLRVWDTVDHRELWTQPIQGSQYAAAAFTPAGRTVFLGEPRGTIREWDVATGKPVRTLEGHPAFMDPPPPNNGFGPRRVDPHPGHMGSVIRLAVSLDGRRLISAATDRTIRIWDLATGKECALLERATGRAPNYYPTPVFALAISPVGGLLAAPGQDGDRRHLIDLWDYRAGRRVATLDGHRGPVTALAFSPDGRRLVSGSTDGLGYVWAVPPRPAGPTTKVDDARVAALWSDLADADAAKAYRAVSAWLDAPDAAVAAFRRLQRPDKPVDAGRVNRLIADLDSDQFAIRDRASKELQALGPAAGRHLRQALAKSPSAEAARRIEAILASCPDEDLRGPRAVEVLEAAGTPAAKVLLAEWAKGDPTATTPREAAAALTRLNHR